MAALQFVEAAEAGRDTGGIALLGYRCRLAINRFFTSALLRKSQEKREEWAGQD